MRTNTRKFRLALIALALVALLLSVFGVVPTLADNDVTSSTMIFEGTLTDEGGGVYSGVLAMVDEAAEGLGDNESGYDVYARNGATAWFGNDPGTGPVWTSVAIVTSPNDHDAWATWDPDTPDWYQYSLNLYVDGGEYKWAVRNHPGATAANPWSSDSATYPAKGVPMSGSMDWTSMYAVEIDTGAYLPGTGTPEIPNGAAGKGGGPRCWDMDWSWGSEVVPLEYAGFDVDIEDLGEDQYRVTLTPAPLSEVWVDNDYDSSTPGWGVTHFDKIQDGVDAIEGSTVHVAAGTYNESNIHIDKAVTIIGAGPASTFVDPGGSGNIFYVDANGVTIRDLTIQNGAQGIRFEKAGGTINNTEINNVHLLNNSSRGIEIHNATTVTDLRVISGYFDSNNIGIRMASSAVANGITITGSTFTGHSLGFYQANDDSSGHLRSLHVDGSMFTNNSFAGVYAEEIRDSIVENSTFTGNGRGFYIFKFYSTAGVDIENVTVRANTFNDTEKAAVLIFACTTAYKTFDFPCDGGGGLVGSGVTVENNTFNQDVGVRPSEWGLIDVRLSSTFTHAPVTIEGNTVNFSGNFGAATAAYSIKLRGGLDDVTVTGNTLNGGNVGGGGNTNNPPTSGIYLQTNDSNFGVIPATAVVNVTTENNITGFVNGVSVYDAVAGNFGGLASGADVNINYNNITGNSTFGAQSDEGEIVDATCNWWGDLRGPYHPVLNPVTTGNEVTDKVAFQPWLTQAAPSACDYEGPITSNVVATPNPVAVNGEVMVTANVDDTITGGSDIASAEYSLDGGITWYPMAAQDGDFDAVSEDVTATFNAPAEAGIYTYNLCIRGTDSAGNTGPNECIELMLVVYDPEGGFVTGGGWIWSVPGAYAADPSLEGKATFGFVSKYKKGAQTPEGNTEFVFKAADLNFHSDSYEWLVVAGAKAQFKGTGTINGEGEYKFMLMAIDADINENDSFKVDRFRIKIWSEDESGNETVVYDNALGDDSDGATTEIGGGSIVIHTKKK